MNGEFLGPEKIDGLTMHDNFDYISELAVIPHPQKLEIGHHVRIDPFAYLTGKIKIGSYVHIPPFTILSGSDQGITIGDGVTISAGVKIYTQSADYYGLTNPTIPKEIRKSFSGSVFIERLVCLFADVIILPKTTIHEGAVFNSRALVTHGEYQGWKIYAGTPAQAKKNRPQGTIVNQLEKLLKQVSKS